MKSEAPEVDEGTNVRLRTGGPVMTVLKPVEHLVMCVWIDEVGRVQRQTFAPDELVAHDSGHLVWLRVLARLSSRFTVASPC